MDEDRIIENIKEIKDLPEKNQWKLVKSHADTAESEIGSHSGAEKKAKKFAANRKYEDKTIQVNEKRLEKVVSLDSSSNLSSNVSEKVQVKFRDGPDEVYDKDLATVPTDQDTSDLLCNYVVLRDDCDPSCRQRTIESNGHFSNVGDYFQTMTKTGVYHHYPHQKSQKICEESNKRQFTSKPLNKNVPTGDAIQFFGNRQKNNRAVPENFQNINHRLNENEKKARSNLGTVAPCRSIKRLKRIFGQEQYSTSSNYKKQDQSNEQHQVKASTKYNNNIQSSRREKCLYHCAPMKSELTHTDVYPTKIAAHENENIAKYTIFDGFHNSKGFNRDTPFLSQYNCKQFANGNGDTEFQNKPSYGINESFEMNDDKGNINLVENGYRITNPLPERIEVYYFDHGSSSYFRTTDHPPPLATDLMIEKTDQMSTRFWAGIFGFLHIFFAVFTSFYLQLYRFVLISSVRPLLIGTFQVSSDYFLKPFLATLFNAIIQPFFILFYNVATSFRDLCEPIARGIGFFLEEVANILRAIRLVEVKNSTRNGPFLNPFRNQAIEI